MARIIDKKKVPFTSVAKYSRPVVVMDLDEFEDILERSDPAFRKSLRKAYEEYTKGDVVDLTDL